MTDVTDAPMEPLDEELPVEAPDRGEQLKDYALDWMETSVVNVITTKLVPQLIAWGGLTLLLAKVQDWIGLDLNPVEVATFIGIVLAGVAGQGIAYVRNHGQGAAILGREMLKVQNIAQEGIDLLGPGALHPGAGGGENIEEGPVEEAIDEAIEESAPGETPVDPSVPPGISEGRIDQ